MLLKLDNPSLLLKGIDMISELVTEVKVKFSEFGLSITAMDPANVSMVGFKLPKSVFSRYESENTTIGVNLDSLKKILKRAGAGSSIIIERKENLLGIQIQDKIKRSFDLSLIDIESEDIDFEAKVGRMEFTARVELDSIDFMDVVEDAIVVADACAFIVDSGKFIIEAKGLNSARAEFSGDEAKINAENCKSRYSLEYLQKFLKGAKVSDKTIISFADDHPLRLDFSSSGMQVSFILAPRVETED